MISLSQDLTSESSHLEVVAWLENWKHGSAIDLGFLADMNGVKLKRFLMKGRGTFETLFLKFKSNENKTAAAWLLYDELCEKLGVTGTFHVFASSLFAIIVSYTRKDKCMFIMFVGSNE